MLPQRQNEARFTFLHRIAECDDPSDSDYTESTESTASSLSESIGKEEVLFFGKKKKEEKKASHTWNADNFQWKNFNLCLLGILFFRVDLEAQFCGSWSSKWTKLAQYYAHFNEYFNLN